MATLAGAFGSLALLLACVGLYGLLAYSVVRRTKEIGIRIALGAQRARVVAMVLAGAVRLVLIGVVLGLPAAWAASRWVRSLLFDVESYRPDDNRRRDSAAHGSRPRLGLPHRRIERLAWMRWRPCGTNSGRHD